MFHIDYKNSAKIQVLEKRTHYIGGRGIAIVARLSPSAKGGDGGAPLARRQKQRYLSTPSDESAVQQPKKLNIIIFQRLIASNPKVCSRRRHHRRCSSHRRRCRRKVSKRFRCSHFIKNFPSPSGAHDNLDFAIISVIWT